MIHLTVSSMLPEPYGLYLMCCGERQYLTNNKPVVLTLSKDDSVTLWQDDPMTKLKKVLASIAIFLTAPLQLAYLYYSDTKPEWSDVIPFRLKAVLQVSGDTACNITLCEGATQFQPPRLERSEETISVVEYTCEASPWRFDQACYFYCCRVISGGIWLLTLMGYLLTVGIRLHEALAILTAGVVCIGTVTLAACLTVRACLCCRRKKAQLKQANG